MKTVKIVTMNGTDIKKSSKLKKTDFGEKEMIYEEKENAWNGKSRSS